VRRDDLLLVNPRYARNPCSSAARHALTPSLALPSIAAATPPGWSVRLHDENLGWGEPPMRPVPEVVGITVHTAFAPRAYELADRYRAAGSRVVLGGLHASALPEEAAAHADAVVVGDGISVWPRVLEGLRSGALGRGALVRGDPSSPPYERCPWPRRDILPRGAFLTRASIIATRGCTQRCGYCYLATRGAVGPYQKRDVDDVLAEIDAVGERFVVFTDNNLMADPAYGARLCRALATRNLLWSAAVTVDVARDPRLVALMAASGCQGVFIGLETLSEAALREQRKRTLAPSHYERAVALLHDHGIEVNGSFVFGFDEDGPEVFDRTLEFIVRQRLECATFHVLTPYPGTPLFERLEAEGRILTRDWSRYDTAHAVFRPARMSPLELEQGYRRAYRELYGWSNVLARRPRGGGAVDEAVRGAAYLAMTALYKKWDFVWRALGPLRLMHAAWRPLVEAHWALGMARRRASLRNRGHEYRVDRRDVAPRRIGIRGIPVLAPHHDSERPRAPGELRAVVALAVAGVAPHQVQVRDLVFP
jgi:radical SAM superfamily enzyme YgiQ (UPF0313 family)